MKMPIFLITFFLSCILSLFSGQVASAKLYKWVDESGKIFFSDKVPPDEAKLRRETLNKQGTVVDVIEQEKTKEQKEQDAKLNELRKKQDRVIKSQKAHDDALLRSYHSKDEILAELKEKTQTLEGQKKLIEAEIAQHLERLDVAQKSAASFERNAKPIPPNLITEIKAIQDEIEKTKKTVNENTAAQKKLVGEYDASVKRFLMLTQPKESTPKTKIPSIEEADALGLFYCENDDQCKQAWEIALVFVKTYSSTGPDIDTDELVIHALPTKDSDFSLSISKIASKDTKDQLFLDIHCRDSTAGKELCASAKIQALRSSFRSYVNERLNSKVPTP